MMQWFVNISVVRKSSCLTFQQIKDVSWGVILFSDFIASDNSLKRVVFFKNRWNRHDEGIFLLFNHFGSDNFVCCSTQPGKSFWVWMSLQSEVRNRCEYWVTSVTRNVLKLWDDRVNQAFFTKNFSNHFTLHNPVCYTLEQNLLHVAGTFASRKQTYSKK